MYGSPRPFWTDNEQCIAVFYEYTTGAARLCVRRWPRQFVSRVALIADNSGGPGDIQIMFPDALEITSQLPSPAPWTQYVTWATSLAALPMLTTHVIIVERVIDRLEWQPPPPFTHNGFQIVVIGPRTPSLPPIGRME